jgi:WD40 repeat protein
MSMLGWRLVSLVLLGVTASVGLAELPAKEGAPGTVAALGRTELPFPAAVSHIAFAPDGKVLAAVGYNSTVRLWDSTTGKQLHDLSGHAEYVNWIAFSPDGKTLASAGQDGTIRLWNVNSGKELAVLKGHDKNVASVAFSPDGRSLASVGYDRSLRLWETATAKEVLRHEDHQVQPSRVAFAPDGKTVATTNYLGEVILTDPLTARPLRSWRGGSECLAFSPDGKTLTSGGREPDPGERSREIKGVVRLWDPRTGTEVAVIKGVKGAVSSVAFSPKGRAIATASGWDEVALWDRLTEKNLIRVQTGAHVTCVALSSDGARLAAGDQSGKVYLWRLAPDKWDQGLQKPELKDEQLAELWKDLADDDAPRAHRAVWTLSAAPKLSVKYLDTRLKPAEATTDDKIRGLIRDLDNNDFETREKATMELTRIAHRAEKLMRAALAGAPSAEARKRLESVVSVIEGTRPEHAPETLRAIRAIHVLELIGTPEARAVLEKLARGASGAYETRHAKAALARLARQVEDEP